MIVRYFRIISWPEVGVGVAYQVPLPTCLKFFVILTNEKAKVGYQTFIKELSNPPGIDTVVILQHISATYITSDQTKVGIFVSWQDLYMAGVKLWLIFCTSKNKTSLRGLSMALMYLWL